MRWKKKRYLILLMLPGAWLLVHYCVGSAVLSAHATRFDVGPGKKLEHLFQVPWDQLGPGDVVRIYYRKKPYNEKFIIRRSGTAKAPIVVTGVPSKGRLPVIEGKNAVQFQSETRHDTGRYLIKIGGQTPGDWVVIRNLHLRNAHNLNHHVSGNGKPRRYTDNAAGIFLYWGRHVTIARCIIQSCGDGILSNHSPQVTRTRITGCYLFNNGNFENPASSQEHNVYLQGIGTIVEFCFFGPVHSDGHLIKDRGKSTVIRYNWLSGGMSRQLDLVEYSGYEDADAMVYGNVIIQGKKKNNYNMIHFGGDSGGSRSGRLFFFNNTVVSQTPKTLFIFNHSDCSVLLANNAFIGGGVLWNGKGRLMGYNNWIQQGIRGRFDKTMAIQGVNPGFMTQFAIPYVPAAYSVLSNNGSNRTPMPVKFMPNPKGGGIRRPGGSRMYIGAYASADRWFTPDKKK